MPEPDTSEPRSLLFAYNGPRHVDSGAPGTVLAIGDRLASRGWSVEYLFNATVGGWRGPAARQAFALRVRRAVDRLRPAVAVVSSADGAFVDLDRSALVMQSHGLEQLRREVSERFGVDREFFGPGHRHLREPLVRRAAERADAVVVRTSHEAEYLTTHFDVPERAVRVIPNGLDDRTIAAGQALRRDPRQRPRVLWVGRWCEVKGNAVVPEVVRRVVSHEPEVVFHFMGIGVAEAELRSRFAADLQANLVVTERFQRDELVPAAAAATCGLATSVFEGFGKMIIEMQALGLPVVSTPAGVAVDVIEPGVTGQLVSTMDGPDIAEMLLRVLGDPQDAARMGENARVRAGRFRWEGIVDQWEALLGQVRGGDRRRPVAEAPVHDVVVSGGAR